MQHSAGQYWIPITAMVHTHNECLADGTDGVSKDVSDDDHATATSKPNLNYFVMGCGALASYNQYSTSYNVVSTAPSSTSCSLVH